MIELILGGARSGKSSLALQRAASSGKRVLFIATATASDEEMRERIARHRAERPVEWRTLEAPIRVAAALREAPRDAFVIVDCLTLWLANVLFPIDGGANVCADAAAFERERDALLSAVRQAACEAVLVSNEVGLGIVPDNAVARRFRDEQGRLNQQLAALCERVTLVVAGIPLLLKQPE
jgi:adenosylcobinamide kinase / adenosylcobinamide-phosphate guanylyltransferase